MEQIKQILKNKKIYLRDFIAIIVIFFLSLFVEQVLLQWNSFKKDVYKRQTVRCLLFIPEMAVL